MAIPAAMSGKRQSVPLPAKRTCDPKEAENDYDDEARNNSVTHRLCFDESHAVSSSYLCWFATAVFFS